MDAFRGLSSAGRTAIDARNVELLTAMQKTIDENRNHDMPLVREANEKLTATFGNLQKLAIMGDTSVAALPKHPRKD